MSITVVIPCYNKGDLVLQTLESLARQTLPAEQILIVNDESTDPLTIATLKGIKQPGVRVLDQKNAGLAAVRNAGFKQATGDYVLFLDNDDMLSSNYLEVAEAALEKNPQAGYAYGGMVMFGEETALKRAGPFSYPGLQINNYIHCSSLFRRSILERWQYDETLKVMEDWDFLLQLAAEGVIGQPLPEAYLYYRVAKSGMNRAHSLGWRNSQIQRIRRNRGVRLSLRQQALYYAGLWLQPVLGPERRKFERRALTAELAKNPSLAADARALNLPL